MTSWEKRLTVKSMRRNLRDAQRPNIYKRKFPNLNVRIGQPLNILIRNINAIPNTVLTLLEQIYKETGLIGCVALAGPELMQGGNIFVQSCVILFACRFLTVTLLFFQILSWQIACRLRV